MKSQIQIVLFLVVVLTLNSLKIQNPKDNQKCDPHGVVNVSVTTNNEEKLYKVASIDIGANGGKVYVCGSDRKVYELIHNENYYIPFTGVTAPIPCTLITVDINGNPWIINSVSEGGIIFRYRKDLNRWERVANQTPAIDISCSKLSDCFYVDNSNIVYRILTTDNRIINMDGRLKWVDASATKLCGIGMDNAFWCKDINQNLEGWVKSDSSCLDAAVCRNGEPYVIGTDSNLYRWDGAKWVALTSTRNVTKIACEQKIWYLLGGIASN